MTDVLVVGDGPTGLQAALLLAKNGMDVDVFGTDDTYLHDAYLYNYLGIEEIHGSDFVDVARAQCRSFDARLHEVEVDAVRETGEGFAVETADGETHTAPYVVLAEGDSRDLAADLDVAFDGDVVETDRNGRTSVENAYAGGWTARDNRIQAAISVGDGAAIAVDILSTEKGRQFHDFDVPEE